MQTRLLLRTDGLLSVTILAWVQFAYGGIASPARARNVSDVLKTAHRMAAVSWTVGAPDLESHCARKNLPGAAPVKWDGPTQHGVPYKWGGLDTDECFTWKHSADSSTVSPPECSHDSIDKRPLSAALHNINGYTKYNACTTGVDCSGLVLVVWGLKGHDEAGSLVKYGVEKTLTEKNWLSELQPGDVLIWNSASVKHAALVEHVMLNEQNVGKERVCVVDAAGQVEHFKKGQESRKGLERNVRYRPMSWKSLLSIGGVPSRLRYSAIVNDKDVPRTDQCSFTTSLAPEPQEVSQKAPIDKPIQHGRPKKVRMPLPPPRDKGDGGGKLQPIPAQATNATTSVDSGAQGAKSIPDEAAANDGQKLPPTEPVAKIQAPAQAPESEPNPPVRDSHPVVSTPMHQQHHHSWAWWLLPWHWFSH
jgi:hypothetical protein